MDKKQKQNKKKSTLIMETSSSRARLHDLVLMNIYEKTMAAAAHTIWRVRIKTLIPLTFESMTPDFS